MSKMVPYIRYTSRDFESIKEDLINYAKKYYPNTFQDFNEGSFGSLMFDTVAYVGDILSYYLDYQANETFLDTAIETKNVLKLGANLGYRPKTAVSSTGILTFYVPVPSNTTGDAADSSYFPIIKKGSTFGSVSGDVYTLVEDVIITTNTANIRSTKLSSRSPYEFTAQVTGRVISGITDSITVSVDTFEKFKKILVGDENVTEILSVTDSDGNIYYEVDYLTQNIIYNEITNTNSDRFMTPCILKPLSVSRRFIVLREDNETYIQFGSASDTTATYNNYKKIDPAGTVLKKYGKSYFSDESFDPTLLITNDKLGVGPSNTLITITFRRNETNISSVPVNGINTVLDLQVQYTSPGLDPLKKSAIENGIIVSNELPISGQSSVETSEELKTKIYGTFAAQNRAVTEEDYKALCYNLPGNLGSVKRVRILRDGVNRNLNLYTISEDTNGNLISTNNSTKTNIKHWLNKNKIINDTIDILDAKIVNFGIYFIAVSDRNFNKYDVLVNALNAIKDEFSMKMDIGEGIQFSRVHEALRKIDGIVDVRSVQLLQKSQSNIPSYSYSKFDFNFDQNITLDGAFLKVPSNVIMELKYPNLDIEGKLI